MKKFPGYGEWECTLVNFDEHTEEWIGSYTDGTVERYSLKQIKRYLRINAVEQRKKRRIQDNIPSTCDSDLIMMKDHNLAVMERQLKSRDNACWAPMVLALARFYGFHQISCTGEEVTLESILDLVEGDIPAHAEQQFSDAFMLTFDVRFFKGQTSSSDLGVNVVEPRWRDHVQKSVASNTPVLLLVKPLWTKRPGSMHYLLCLGYEKLAIDSSDIHSLQVKDPDHGDTVLTAELWKDQQTELTTLNSDCVVLGRFQIIEAIHMPAKETMCNHSCLQKSSEV